MRGRGTHGAGQARPGLTLPCHIVRGFTARLRGLLWRPAPAPGTGWWFSHCRAVHTIGMRYPIDVVFLCAEDRVLRVAAGLPSGRVCWQAGAAGVVELAAGQAAYLGIVPGVRLVITTWT